MPSRDEPAQLYPGARRIIRIMPTAGLETADASPRTSGRAAAEPNASPRTLEAATASPRTLEADANPRTRTSRRDAAQIVVDHWQRLADDDPLPSLDALPVLVSQARAAAERIELDARLGGWGVWIPCDADPEQVAAAFGDRPVIAIVIAKFSDGRHFSTARLLRERYRYAGDLRAVGNVLPDQLDFMRRCGYSSFELQPGKSLETGLRALGHITVAYQR